MTHKLTSAGKGLVLSYGDGWYGCDRPAPRHDVERRFSSTMSSELSAARVAPSAGAALLTLTFLIPPPHAGAQDPTVPSRRAPAVSRDMRYREWILRELARKGKKPPEQLQEVNWEQVREDFRSIQLESRVLKSSATREPSDLRAVEKAASEILRRATRLDAELTLPEGEGGEKTRGGSPDLSGLSLSTVASALEGVVRRFVTNPIFDEAEVLDVPHAYKAKHDLERIIRLSREVKMKLSASEM